MLHTSLPPVGALSGLVRLASPDADAGPGPSEAAPLFILNLFNVLYFHSRWNKARPHLKARVDRERTSVMTRALRKACPCCTLSEEKLAMRAVGPSHLTPLTASLWQPV